MPSKTFVYVDGYNLYNGLMDPRNHIDGDMSPTPFRKYLWLNLHTFISSFLPIGYELVKIHYFTATVRDKPESKKRQQTYWKALETIPDLERHLGKHIPDGKGGYVEKQSDVNLALQMYCDVIEGKTQSIVLVSGDSDQVPTIKLIQELNRGIDFFAIFPPFRVSDDIRALIPRNFKVKEARLRENQFPDIIKVKGIPDIIKPPGWS